MRTVRKFHDSLMSMRQNNQGLLFNFHHKSKGVKYQHDLRQYKVEKVTFWVLLLV